MPVHGGECHTGSARVPWERAHISACVCVCVRALKPKGGRGAGGRKRRNYFFPVSKGTMVNLLRGPGPRGYSLWLLSIRMWEGRFWSTSR